ncbi:MAG: nucleoside hydrolase [Bacteroidetes bacterium]|nr:nucleoside hydrolase [Bacteroidota bacterium]
MLTIAEAQVNIIFDANMGSDYDDAGAIAILHNYADEGKAKILATIGSAKFENAAAVFSVFNTYFNKQYIPVAIPKGEAPILKTTQRWTDSVVARYPHPVNSNKDVPDAVALYRRILSIQPDNSVTIIALGYLTNLKSLLLSKADLFSPISGEQLVQQKVKQLVCLAGKFPEGNSLNISHDVVAAKYVLEHWPAPVLFCGMETGDKIKTGLSLIQNDSIQNSPVKDAFRLSVNPENKDTALKKSHGEIAVLVGIEGYENWFDVRQGKIIINEKDGSNKWIDDSQAEQYYLVEKSPPAVIQKIINELLQHQPQ